jgi:hypothetical protein
VRILKLLVTVSAVVLFCNPILALESFRVTSIEPTPLFPRQAEGQPLRQLVRLHLDNPGEPFAAAARITLGSVAPEIQNLGTVAKGESVVGIRLADITVPTPLKVELLSAAGMVLTVRQVEWQPQRKWVFYCCSYSHQDLGFGDYPHRLRTSIRHENIRIPLQFCRETDSWPEEAQYRFNIETSEPLTSFISFNGKEAARELAGRIREGRIGLGGMHNTCNTEELSHELLARLFYMSGRYGVDLLGVPAGKTIQQTDAIGLSWPVATYAKEAGFEYCFHGFNFMAMPNIDNGRIISSYEEFNREVGRHVFSPANEPNYLWQGPDGQQLLRRATGYERHSLVKTKYDPSPNWTMPDRVELLIRAHEKMKWPFSSILSQDGSDFTLAWRNVADAVHQWNTEYSYPRLREAIFDDYFHAIEKEMAEKKIQLNTVAGDENNQWSDQDYAAARSTGLARRLSESLPATETLASFSQSLVGGNDQWINLFQGYHRLLAYFEHTNAKNSPSDNMAWYETELEENREMVTEAAGYQQQVFTHASRRLASAITRSGEKNLVVFNPLPYLRTDIVRAVLPAGRVVDSVTGAEVPVQQLADGTAVFVAENIPATGYKTYSLLGGPGSVVAAAPGALENRFYRLQFNPATGVLTSLFDKTLGIELIEKNAPQSFNEYLYEFRSNIGGMNFNSAWSRLEKADAVTVSHGQVADVLTISGKAEGVRALRQTILLYHDLPRVDFSIWLDKAPFRGKFSQQHEAVFVALPLAIPNFTIRHELPGCVIEPYREQVEGSATDHYAIRSFTDLSNQQYGVTVCPVEGSLVCYGAPTTTPLAGHEYNFKRDRTYPATSRLYLYLMDNMFDCNIAADQQGPVSFQWALRSHAGDWKRGKADQFGRSVQQPLLAWRADGKNAGTLPASASFMSIDAPNVMCSVIKPAEANGRGFILRLHETTGRETTATISLPMLPPIESIVETSLVENDRAAIGKGNTFAVTFRPFGVKTLRVTCAPSPLHVTGLGAKAVADMQVDLTWQSTGQPISHFNIYRDTNPECAPTQLNLIGQIATGSFSDRPQVNPGGWLRSCLRPKTTYYYRVLPVDRANNPGAPSGAITVTTPASAQADLPPVEVEGLRAILVSPISQDNFVNLLFRTACEPDVAQYEVHRSTRAGFAVDGKTLVGVVKSDDLPPRSGGYGESKVQYKVKDYDHATFADKTVEAGTTYYYKVRAVDTAGQKGGFSGEVPIRTKVAITKKLTSGS